MCVLRHICRPSYVYRKRARVIASTGREVNRLRVCSRSPGENAGVGVCIGQGGDPGSLSLFCLCVKVFMV
nr:MAG TPA: hypothetical protein [Caudoviricetes sp.]